MLRGKVALPCDVSAPSEDDSVALILWYKDDALAPIYTLDARKGLFRSFVVLLLMIVVYNFSLHR